MYKPKKELGQNFLTDMDVARKMVSALKPKKEETIVEIGAGLGVLTEVLSEKTQGKKVEILAIEIDNRFIEKLNTMFLSNPDLQVIEADILRWLPSYKPEKSFKVLGSLPYYITSPIVHSLVRHTGDIEIIVLLVQKEVAQKIAAKAPKASYLSTFVQTFFDVDLLDVVSRDKFRPSPKVDGGIITLTKRKEVPVTKKEILEYEDFLHKGFSKPRKMLNKVFSKEVLAELKTDDKLRPQHIKVEKWIELYRKMTA